MRKNSLLIVCLFICKIQPECKVLYLYILLINLVYSSCERGTLNINIFDKVSKIPYVTLTA